MLRLIAVFLLGGVFGTAFGVAAGVFVYPFVFPPPAAMDTLTAQERETLVAAGRFIRAYPSDPIHYGSGGVVLFEGAVFLGAAYHAHLVLAAEIRDSGVVRDTMGIALGKLRAFEGSQKYPIPAGVDLADYPSVPTCLADLTFAAS